MNEIEHFTFYGTFESQLEDLPEEQQNKFYRAIIRYGLHGETPEFSNPLETALFKQFKFAIDNQRSKLSSLSCNGKKGGRPKKEGGGEETEKPSEANENLEKANESKQKQTKANESKEKQTKANESKIAEENRIEKEYEDEMEGERERETHARCASPPKKSHFHPPTVDEVREYCRERGNAVKAESFIAFYESKGWYVGRNKMTDWKAAVRTWEHRDQEKKPATVWQKEHDAAADYMDLI